MYHSVRDKAFISMHTKLHKIASLFVRPTAALQAAVCSGTVANVIISLFVRLKANAVDLATLKRLNA